MAGAESAARSVSIVTINRNDRDGLRRTIESVVAQTTRDFEYIVIDGASTDGSVAVIAEYASQIDYWVSEPDGGIYSAMNKAADRATGEFILYLNSGDVIYPDTLATILANREAWWECDVVYGNIVNSTTSHLDVARDIDQLMHRECFIHQAVMVKSAVQRKLRFDLSFKVAADYDMFVRAFKGGYSFHRVSVTFGEYDGTGLSNRNYFRTMNEFAQSLWRNHRGRGRIRAVAAYWWGRRVFITYLLAVRLLGQKRYRVIREALR
jgi:glycosyltransferase involved in cell wall biosynthesis